MGVSKNRGTPKSSILIGISIINHPFWVPLFLETPICSCIEQKKLPHQKPGKFFGGFLDFYIIWNILTF